MGMKVFVGCLLLCGFLSALEVSASCASCVDPQSVPSTHVVHKYNESQEYVENPHRGFVVQMVTHSSHHHPLSKSRLDQLRHRSGITMIWRTFVLDTFVTSSISDDYLNKIRHDLDMVESAGFTVVLRFCYIFEMKHNHPWGDASKDVVLGHIGQLRPLLQRYQGVITSIEAGFIGAWGEWHHTEHFGNPSFHSAGHDPVTGLMPQAFRDRQDVLLALLRAAPISLQVQLRYPAQKMHMLGSVPSTLVGVQRGTDTARTGHHNDCFVSSDKDVGTYRNKTAEYPYLQQDTRYTIMGGETCRVTNNHRHECPTATKEMAMFHWTFLNQAYNDDIYTVWKQQGCYSHVHRQLGYRLVITKAILPRTARVDDDLCFHLEFTNLGFAAPVKNLGLSIVLQSTDGSGHYYAGQVKGVDVRDWQPVHPHSVTSAVKLSRVPEGHYKVLLLLSDPLMGHHSADYNVLLASTGVSLHTQGLNDLHHTITVAGQHTSSSNCTSSVSPWTPPAPSHYSRVFTGTF
ncbi:uncharacterized protein LOC143297393 [Babylonia areolata]|uniref:uncharacterized protein LOC143297393 n=1 Tax=Babylonia areolata TaxID=304850 RepID=UPI003FD0F82F